MDIGTQVKAIENIRSEDQILGIAEGILVPMGTVGVVLGDSERFLGEEKKLRLKEGMELFGPDDCYMVCWDNKISCDVYKNEIEVIK